MQKKEVGLKERTRERFDNCLELMNNKNDDYTGGKGELHNFELSALLGFADRENGIGVRFSDKVSRIAALLNNEAKVSDETIQDTINDGINYLAILGYALEQRQKGL